MTNQELIAKLNFSARKYSVPLKQRFIKYPFISLRDIFITILFYKILKQKFYFKVKAKTFWGDYFYCIFPESKDIYFYGGYVWLNPELRLTKFIITNKFKEDGVFFGLGAHYGYYSVLLSYLYPKAKIYAFEPDPNVLEILRLNKRSNIEIIPKAVTDKEGILKFASYDLLSSAISRLTSALNNLTNSPFSFKNYKEIDVETISLDKFCEENNITPDFIKIDVEGAEFSVLQGAKNVLKNFEPIIALEILFKPFSENYKKSIEFLESLNYKMFAINDDGSLKEINPNKITDYFTYLENKYKEINYYGCVFDNFIFKKE